MNSEFGMRKGEPIALVREAAINSEVAIQSRFVNLPHQDPADSFIAATAIVYDLTLVTADAKIIDTDAVNILPAI